MAERPDDHSSMLFCLGVLAGVICAVYGMAAANGQSGASVLSSADAATLISGFGGAALGGGVSWFLGRQAAHEAASRDQQQHKRDQRAQGIQLFLKFSMIASDLAGTKVSINQSLERANALGLTSQALWQRIVPIVGSLDHVTIEPTDMTPLIDAREYDLVAQIIEVAMQHKMISQSLEKYTELHAAAEAILGPAQEYGEGGLYTGLTQDGIDRLRPVATKLEALINQIRLRLEILIPQANNAMAAIGPAMQKYLNDISFPIVDLGG
ncbi:hypothetical protein EHI44_02075 [Rhizobium leguminosarum]|uniref:hypothetical protein n=1 Tax=Rhizobium leguminosarum TaxID=384 RepID=UPI000FF26461|nr:hypothetical protein [Rhizobium leguminosarum]RWY91846.1 hypothetical protein EHI44_02075 [Rhizobium leguminosarum]